MTYDIHQTKWAHDCALAIEKIVPLDGPSMARVEAALLERWPVADAGYVAMLERDVNLWRDALKRATVFTMNAWGDALRSARETR